MDKKIKVIDYNDPRYPRFFKLIKDPPKSLFCKGDTKLLNRSNNIAIIGMRDCTKTGSRIAFEVAGHFVNKGYTIVSGLARGIDTAAHRGTLKAGGRTIAVMASIDNIFPTENLSGKYFIGVKNYFILMI